MSATFRGATRLSDWGVIRAQGDQARSFLQSQLTQDVQSITGHEARLAGYCSAKGRLLATFVVWADGPQDLLLACSADLLPTVLKRLSMYVLRARCKLSDASAHLGLWGVVGRDDGPEPWMCATSEAQKVIGLPPAWVDGQMVPRSLVVAPASAPAPGQTSDEGVWARLEVTSGVPRVVAATSEHFVPQMINLEVVGGVSFQKGCYPGQEVVARSQYRGTLKRRGYVLTSEAPAVPGQEVFGTSDPEQPAGEVVLAATQGTTHVVFAELKIAAATAGGLRLGSAAGPGLTLSALPYSVPTETA